MAARPRAVAFDVIETLMPLHPLRTRLEEIGLPGDLLQPWFLRTLRDAIALSVTGEFQPFPVVARQALRTEAGHAVTGEQADHLIAGFAELPAHADVAPAMRRLTAAGVRVSCLTNGSPEATEAFVRGAGLDGYVERVVTVQEAGAYKPAAAVYRTAAAALGLEPGQVALVAAHAWDCHGAKRAGLVTGWVSRFEGSYSHLFDPPDVTGDDLDEVAARLVGA